MAIEKFYWVKEVCELLGGICRNKLWELRRDGQIGFVRIGNRPVFPASYVEAYQRQLLGREPVAYPEPTQYNEAAREAGTRNAIN